ncbi:MAG: sugar phosphate isomerase/epimerase [Clostridia bacterium]|nr:sugar phosphate isomerase/epimerase [Clostridia bacterium]
MYKGISFYFGYDIPIKERARMIANVGFSSVITNADKKLVCQNDRIEKQVKVFKEMGLHCSSLHMRYNREDLPHFFKKDKIGKKLEKNLKKDLKIAKKYGFSCVVVHLAGEISFEGVERFKRILNVAEKVRVPLALENLIDLNPLFYFLDNFKSEYVKFCYDSGHNNAFNKEVDLLEKYGDRLVCVHLHDNDGKDDLHGLNRFGTIDWQDMAKKLAKTNLSCLDYELLPRSINGLSAQETLVEGMKQANELEEMIMKEKALLEKGV